MAVSTITYSNKVALNENQSVADINKVKADDMNEIKSVVNNNATETSNNANAIVNLQIYSTNEVNTGKIWIDGKPIYRKTFTTTNLPGNATTTLGSISDLDTVIDINGIIPLEPDASTKQYITLNHIRSSSLNWAFAPIVTNNDIQIMRGSFGTVSGTVHVTVEYTKTTN